AGLRSTEDKDLLPLFASLMQSSDKRVRLVATAMVARVGGKDAAGPLLERLRKDPSMVVRSKALVELDLLKAISVEQLIEATRMPDEEIQILAARALARGGQGKKASAVLKKLVESRDKTTATFARMTLLGIGDRPQIGHLRKVLLDPKTTQQLLVFMLNQIREEKILAALPVAEFLAKPDQLMPVRIRAYMTINELSPKAAFVLAQAIRLSKNTMFRINLMRLLSERKDAHATLETFAKGDDILAAVARFELARPAGGKAATQTVSKLLDMGHPILIEYVLNRMRKDIAADKTKADFYTAPVLKLIRSTKLDPQRMTATHDKIALAVELLSNLGSSEAIKGIWDILSNAKSLATRSLTAGALYRSTNKAVGDLVRPLLKSGYPELKTYAALLLARQGDQAAVPVLLEIQETAKTQKDDVLTLANWYLLKLSGQSEKTLKAMAKTLR
ncbi:MAG: HEAT repeat domain-containing protein, partial [Phycisphaerae bacterium]|nr:HEAT repeat domain-containing protein [Phycisphaerae bacterium]